jgi:lysophospholipase L1-like esterase
MHNLIQSAVLRHFANIALLLASLFLAVIFAEIVLRGLGYSKIYDIYSKQSMFWEYDPLLGWRHQKNADGVFRGPKPFPIEFDTRIKTNSLGLRGEEISPLPQDGYRILFLGDSQVAAFEVEQEDTFVHLLQKKLINELNRPVQVINAGVRGYGTDQSYLYYTSDGRNLKPHLVVFMHTANDLMNNTTLHRMKRPFGKSAIRFTEDEEREVINVPVPQYDLCSAYSINHQYVIERTDTAANRLLCYLNFMLVDRSVLLSFVLTTINKSALGSKERLAWLERFTKPSQRKLLGNARTHDFRGRQTALIIRAMSEAVEADQTGFLAISKSSMLEQIDESLLVDVDIFELDIRNEGATWRNDAHYNEYGHELVANEIWQLIASKLRDLDGREQ